jgi:hypothetical protein
MKESRFARKVIGVGFVFMEATPGQMACSGRFNPPHWACASILEGGCHISKMNFRVSKVSNCSNEAFTRQRRVDTVDFPASAIVE